MKKIKVTKEVAVDTGEVMALLRQQASDNSIELTPGCYKIKLSVKDSWNRKNSSENYLVVSKHRYLCLSDGFNKDEEGERFFESDELYKKGCALRTGGDGMFNVTIELVPVRKIGADPFKVLYAQAKMFYKKRPYNEKNSKLFNQKFLAKVYYRKINDIAQKQEIKQLKEMNRKIKKLLSRMS